MLFSSLQRYTFFSYDFNFLIVCISIIAHRLQVRAIVSDFAVIIAIFSMSAMDYFVGIATPKLEVPVEFKPTLEGRGWMIWPFNRNPWWSALIAIAPALLGTILIFMDQQITAVIVNRKENKLKVRTTKTEENIHIIDKVIRDGFIMCALFSFVERVWLPLGSFRSGDPNRGLFRYGSALVCGCDSTLDKPRQLVKVRIRMCSAG